MKLVRFVIQEGLEDVPGLGEIPEVEEDDIDDDEE